MNKIIVTGIGTDIGKTIASAVLLSKLKADYWKPIQCGDDHQSDADTIKALVDSKSHHFFPSIYKFKASLSPHHASRLENEHIDTQKIVPPKTEKTLVIETVGGVMVPFTNTATGLDIFAKWEAQWIIVSRHYLGSINHTLLTVEALQNRGLNLLGIIFNGEPNPDSESAIMQKCKLRMIGRLLPEPFFNQQIIEKYAKEWQLH